MVQTERIATVRPEGAKQLRDMLQTCASPCWRLKLRPIVGTRKPTVRFASPRAPLILTMVCGMLIVVTAPAFAGASPTAPATTANSSGLIASCAQCHGADGEGQPATGFPRLMGQVKEYLVKQLQDFRTGKRKNPIMTPIAEALDERAINVVSEFYADIGPKRPSTRRMQPERSRELGASLAHTGNWAVNVPACFACHGPGGLGVPPHFPAIAAQNRAYTAKQLRDWKTGQRLNDPLGMMKAIADKLTDAEIDAVSAYLERGAAPVAGK